MNIKNIIVFVGIFITVFVAKQYIGKDHIDGLLETNAVAIVTSLFLILFYLAYTALLNKKNTNKKFDSINDRLRILGELLENHNEVISKIRYRTEDGDSQRADLVAEMKVLQTLLSQIASTKTGTASKPIEPLEEQFVDDEEMEETSNLNEASIATIMENALKENRVDLYLQPIVNLPSRRHEHYECFTRVRDENGEIIFARDYMPFVEKTGAAGTLDNLLLFRVTQIVRKLAHRRPKVKFFCNISSSSLNDDEFFPQFADFLLSNEILSDRLVFEFAQEDVLNMTPQLERDLLALGQKGYRYSMDKVSDVDFDIITLAQRYFRYIKIDGSVFLKGDSGLHPEDLKEAMERQEIILIASKIEDEKTVVNILDCNVDFGQGFLFGEPKLSTMAMDDDGESTD